jgi:hypothetical protein
MLATKTTNSKADATRAVSNLQRMFLSWTLYFSFLANCKKMFWSKFSTVSVSGNYLHTCIFINNMHYIWVSFSTISISGTYIHTNMYFQNITCTIYVQTSFVLTTSAGIVDGVRTWDLLGFRLFSPIHSLIELHTAAPLLDQFCLLRSKQSMVPRCSKTN